MTSSRRLRFPVPGQTAQEQIIRHRQQQQKREYGRETAIVTKSKPVLSHAMVVIYES